MCSARLWPLPFPPSKGYLPGSAGVAELVDAPDLNDLSAHGETLGVELLKFGETIQFG